MKQVAAPSPRCGIEVRAIAPRCAAASSLCLSGKGSADQFVWLWKVFMLQQRPSMSLYSRWGVPPVARSANWMQR